MSGGSHDYLSRERVGALFEEASTARHNLERMRDELAELGYAPDAVVEIEQLLTIVHAQEVRVAARFEHLRPILHAVEWWKSGDYAEDDLRKALTEWREESGEQGRGS